MARQSLGPVMCPRRLQEKGDGVNQLVPRSPKGLAP
ncbi:unnamed protein product [Staurois parvus]|uniref:Uncharacterized protein n=1 Tax=Staurois parvus TaxID=386267 RepID=A0ABN9FBN1_9NEOB|nr:unnamed protein product [Staurois parvus]